MTFSTKYFDAKWHLRHKLFSKSWLGFGWVFFLFFSEGKKKKRLHRVTFANEQRKGPSFPHHKQRGQGGRVTEWTKQTAPAGANAPKKNPGFALGHRRAPAWPLGTLKGLFSPFSPIHVREGAAAAPARAWGASWGRSPPRQGRGYQRWELLNPVLPDTSGKLK